MKKILMIVVTGLVLFAASFGGSWYFLQTQSNGDETGDSTISEIEQAGQFPDPLASSSDNTSVVAFQPDDISVEAMLRIAGSIKNREEALEMQTKLLHQRQERLDVVMADLDREQTELQNMSSSIDQKLSRVDQLVNQVSQMQASREPEPTADDDVENSPSEKTRIANEKKIADLWKGMPPETTAGSIREFVNDGRIEQVARILLHLEQRDSAKILPALGDEKMISEIIREMLKIKAAK